MNADDYSCGERYDEKFVCTICSNFAAPTFKGVFRHIRSDHALQANFSVRCGISGCQALYKKIGSWSKHINRHHKSVNRADLSPSIDPDLSNDTPDLNHSVSDNYH